MYDSSLIAVLGALEDTPGTDPGSGYQGVLVNADAKINPTGDQITRDTARSHRSPQGHVIGAKGFDLTLPVELKGGGFDESSNLRKPETDWMLQASAMSVAAGAVVSLSSVTGTYEVGETVTNGTTTNSVGTVLDVVHDGSVATLFIEPLSEMPSDTDSLTGDTSGATGTVAGDPADAWVYKPVSERAQMKTATCYFHWDGMQHVANYVRGTWDLKTAVNGFGTWNFQLQGTYNAPTNVALPSPTLYDVAPPVCHGAGLQIGDIDMSKTAVNAFELKIGNTVEARPDMNAAEGRRGFEIVGTRDAGGSIDPEVTALADFDPWAAWKNGTGQRLYATYGSTAGERCRVLVRDAQYDELGYGNRAGSLTYQLPFTARGVNGDDEMILIFY